MTKRQDRPSKAVIPFPEPGASPAEAPGMEKRESNQARAERLRPHVERWVTDAGSIKAFAARAELHPRAIGRYLRRQVTPSPGALDAFEDLLGEERRGGSPTDDGRTE